MRKYWIVEVIENYYIVTRVGVYDEILPEPSSREIQSVTFYFFILPISQHQKLSTIECHIVSCSHFYILWRFPW